MILIGASVHKLEKKVCGCFEGLPHVNCVETYSQGLSLASDYHPNVEMVVVDENAADKDDLYDLAMNIHPGDVFVIAGLDDSVEHEHRLIGDIKILHINSHLSADEVVNVIRQ